MASEAASASSTDVSASQRTKQQTSSRMMKTTRRGRPYAKDTHDLFATLIVSLQLTTHRQYFKTYHNSFTTDEAAENLSALKFSQSNRAPDPREPSRVVTTTTTTTFSMNREMAKGICQHFMDARLIENAADPASGVFKDKGVYQLTPKGLHILERFITKNGINGEHLLKVFSSQPICMKLLHLERRAHDDELLINRPIIEVLFRRFCGRQPNYLPGSAEAPSAGYAEFDRTMGIGLQDLNEKVKGSKTHAVVKHTFSAIAALDWLVDFTTICGRDEAAEVAAHFQRLGLVELVRDTSRRDSDEDSTIVVRGEDGIGRVSEGEFRCHYKAVYGMSDKGRAVARWPGYAHLIEKTQTMTIDSRDTPPSQEVPLPRVNSMSGPVGPPGAGAGAGAGAGETESIDSRQNEAGGHRQDSQSNSQDYQPGARQGPASAPRSIESSGSATNLGRKPSAAEKLRNEYLGRSSSNPHFPPDLGSPTYNSRDSNTNRLRQILEEPALRSLFRDFLKQNFCEENLSFWLDVQDFKRRFHTTSSAVAVRPGAQGSSDKPMIKRGLFNRGNAERTREKQGQGFTAMEKHQQDLIAMAFVIYNTYLAPASPCELNIEHNLRTELVTYMNKVLSDAKTAGGDGVRTVRAQDLQKDGSGGDGSGTPSIGSGDGGLAAAFAGPNGAPVGPNASVEERKSTVSASMPRAPLHASQLQTIVRLYERIQDHTFRLMATDSVPRFIKDARFLGLVRSVEEYTEALESGRLDPNDVAGPAISKTVVDAMELGMAGGLPPT